MGFIAAACGGMATSTSATDDSCMGCGARLKIGGDTPRIGTCDYCEATIYLPDALGLQLHPAQRKRAFYILLTLTDKARQRVTEASSSARTSIRYNPLLCAHA